MNAEFCAHHSYLKSNHNQSVRIRLLPSVFGLGLHLGRSSLFWRRLRFGFPHVSRRCGLPGPFHLAFLHLRAHLHGFADVFSVIIGGLGLPCRWIAFFRCGRFSRFVRGNRFAAPRLLDDFTAVLVKVSWIGICTVPVHAAIIIPRIMRNVILVVHPGLINAIVERYDVPAI